MLEMTRRLAHEQPPIADGTEAIAAAAPSVASGLHAGPHGGTLDEQLVQQEHGRSRQEEQ